MPPLPRRPLMLGIAGSGGAGARRPRRAAPPALGAEARPDAAAPAAAAAQRGAERTRHPSARAAGTCGIYPRDSAQAGALLRAEEGSGPRSERPRLPLPEGTAGGAGPDKRTSTFVAGQQEKLFVQGGLLLHLSHVLQRQQLVRRGRGRRVRALVQGGHSTGSARPIRARIPGARYHPGGSEAAIPGAVSSPGGQGGAVDDRSPLHCAGPDGGSQPVAGGARGGSLLGVVVTVRPRAHLAKPPQLPLRPRLCGLPSLPTALRGPAWAPAPVRHL